MHYIYIVECADSTYYTGYATNVKRRIEEHNNSIKGAKYTRGRRPVTLRYSEEFNTKSEACKREYEIKKLPRHKKELLISKNFNDHDS